MRDSNVLAAGILFAGLLLLGNLSAHDWESKIGYSTDNVSVTGSSRTWAETGDVLATQECIMWLWDGFQMTSGYRCPHGNASIPRAASDSKHMHGRAADLLRPGWSEKEFEDLKQLAEEFGAVFTSEFTDYPNNHLHITF